MRSLILPLLLLTFGALGTAAQGLNCDSSSFTDADKRDFANVEAFKFDVDGDGKVDTITPRLLKVKTAGKKRSKIRETHWITFDLRTSSGTVLNSFFKYKYGDSRADYWVYALVPCKILGTREYDLLFYTGDDTSDETVVLQNRATSFKVHSRKTTEF